MNWPVVTVKQGKLQGILQENVLGSHYFAFKGIPFAAPPVGKLRFQDPRSPASWDGIRDASKNGDISLQYDFSTQMVIGSEDCLYLNVYVPYDIHGTTNNPVMIWIHGGAFITGTGNDTKQRYDYLLAKKIILVSINYRLGAFGFLNLGHETASGNQGLKDQIAALKWVKENIDVFGGNQENITIFGNSAGAVSVHLLMLSPLSKGLFHKAILQSGLSICNWAIKETKQEVNSFKLASILGNDSKNPEETVEFLRTISADEIIRVQCQMFTKKDKYGVNIPFTPTLDKEAERPLFPHPIQQLIDDDNDIPVIVGHTSHEYILYPEESEKVLKMIYENLPYYVHDTKKIEDPTKVMQFTERIKEWYFNGKPCENSLLSIVQCMSDIMINIPVSEFINNRRKKKEALTYFYKFFYVGNETSITRAIGRNLAMIGATHGDETSYLFYKSQYKINDPEPPAKRTKDRKIMEALTTMWTNFAKTGNPTPVLDQNVTTTWLPATPDAFNCLEINDSLQCTQITDYINIFEEFY